MRKILSMRYITACFAMIGALLLQSCNEDELFDVMGSTENKVYINAQTWAPLNLPKNSFLFSLIHTPIGSFGNNITVKLPVQSTHVTQNDLKVTLEIDNSLVEGLNEKSGLNFIPVPDGIATLDNTILTISKGKLTSSDSIVISIQEDKFSLLPEPEYLLPIKISAIDYSSGASISSNLNAVYVIIRTVEKNVYDYSSAGDMVGELVTDKADWDAEVSVPFVSGTIADMWDTRTSRFWRVDSQEFEWTVDMAQFITGITGIRIHTNHSLTGFTKMRVWSSSDNENWHSQGVTEMTAGVVYQYIKFYSPIDARYLKFEVLGWNHATQIRVALFDVYTN